jgi:RNA polymerase sigma factor for flagellar operon FliA
MSALTDALWQKYREDRDEETRRLLLDQYLGLVHHAARELMRSIPRGLDLEDLVSAGSIGLVQALEGFDSTRGLAFSTFAVPRIRGAMLDEIRGWDWCPRSVRERARKIEHARLEIRQREGREPDPAEVAEALGIEPETLATWIAEADGPQWVAFDPVPLPGAAREARLTDTLADPAQRPVTEYLEEEEAYRLLSSALDALSSKDRLILSLYYFEDLTLRQIGELMRITESRVSQLHARALKRVREWIASEEERAA